MKELKSLVGLVAIVVLMLVSNLGMSQVFNVEMTEGFINDYDGIVVSPTDGVMYSHEDLEDHVFELDLYDYYIVSGEDTVFVGDTLFKINFIGVSYNGDLYPTYNHMSAVLNGVDVADMSFTFRGTDTYDDFYTGINIRTDRYPIGFDGGISFNVNLGYDLHAEHTVRNDGATDWTNINTESNKFHIKYKPQINIDSRTTYLSFMFHLNNGTPESYDIAATATVGGTALGSGTFEEGTTIELEAMASTGYTFTNWTEDGAEVSTDAIYSFIVTEDRDLVANFYTPPTTYEINLIAGTGGFVNGSGTYNEGTTVDALAITSTGYDFINWTEDGTVVSTELTYSFTATEDRDLVANFELETGINSFSNNSNNEVKLFPNPVINTLNIENGELVRVFDIKGNLLVETTENSVDMSEMKAGMYLVNVDGIQFKITKK